MIGSRDTVLELECGGRHLVTLTTRENEVLRLVADGLPTAAIAERLGIAQTTVAMHLVATRQKFAVRSTAAAATVARQHGMI